MWFQKLSTKLGHLRRLLWVALFDLDRRWRSQTKVEGHGEIIAVQVPKAIAEEQERTRDQAREDSRRRSNRPSK